MIRCLLVDDDHDIRVLLLEYLQQFGIEAEVLADGAALRRRLGGTAAVDLLLLDLMLPDENGLALFEWVRHSHPELPVIMLTAQGDPLSRVLGLELGADDYLAKPFEPRELVARIKAVLRRGSGHGGAQAASAAQLRFDGWTFDRLRRQVVGTDGVVVALSSAEFRLLSAFVDHPGRVLSREQLLDLSRAPGTDVCDRSVDLAVSRLRSKMGGAARSEPLIRTMRGEGYLFDAKVLR